MGLYNTCADDGGSHGDSGDLVRASAGERPRWPKATLKLRESLIVIVSNCYTVKPLQAHVLTYRTNSNGDLIAVTVRSISQYMSLERLDGITVAYDYDEALAQLERGFRPSRPLARTSTDEITGVAMAPAVIRAGVVKAHLVFHAPYVLGLEAETDSDDFKRALYTVAHECAHVDDLKQRDESFPKTILQ